MGYALCLLILFAGAPTYQFLSSRRDWQEFPPPGELIDVGGFHLHLYCAGERMTGKPIIILEGGLGAPSLMWSAAQPEIARQTRVCSYDRAGYAWSESSPNPRTALQVTRELHTLLERAGEKPPYIMVGHSFGGIVIRIFTAEYPDEVSGLILADARHEDFFKRMPPEYLISDQNNYQRAKYLKLFTPLGFTRIAGQLGYLEGFDSYLAPLPDDVKKEAWALMIYNPRHWATSVAERDALKESYQQVRLASLPRNIPLIVLTAENGTDAWRYSPTPVDDEARSIWMGMQEELSRLSTRGQWIIVKDAGHYVYFDEPGAQPGAIVAAIKTILEELP